MINLKYYRRLRKRGYTILGLYKTAKQEGYTADEIVNMLEIVLPSSWDSYQDGDRVQIIKFVRRMEYGEEDCMACQKPFKGEPGEWCPSYCPTCQKKIDDLWEQSLTKARESGEELTEDKMMHLGIWIDVAVALNNRKISGTVDCVPGESNESGSTNSVREN